MNWIQNLPVVSVTCNALTAILVLAAVVAIKKGYQRAHKALMVSALVSSAVFLTSYLIFHFANGILHYEGTGLMRILYFCVLIPHTILAVVLLPLIASSVVFALRGSSDRHRRLGPVTAFTWLYVSVTGVLLFSVFMPAVG